MGSDRNAERDRTQDRHAMKVLALELSSSLGSVAFREGGGTLSYWRDQFPWGWLLILFGLGVYIFAAQKILAKISGASASIFFFLVMFWLVYTYYV